MPPIDRKISGEITVENEGKIHVSGDLETRSHADVIKDNKAREKVEDARHFWTLAINTLTLIAVAGATYYAGTQVTAAQRQLKASKEQTTLAERPWISYTAEKDSAFYFDENGANFRMKFKLHNSGQTPATNVHTFVGFVPEGRVNSNTELDKKYICDKGAASIDFSQQTLFPGTDGVQVRKFRLAPEVIAKYSKDGALSLHIISCVVYRSTLDDKPIYTSGGELYTVGYKPRETFPFNPVLRINVDIPIDDLAIDVEGTVFTLMTGSTVYHSHSDDTYAITDKNMDVYMSGMSADGTAVKH